MTSGRRLGGVWWHLAAFGGVQRRLGLGIPRYIQSGVPFPTDDHTMIVPSYILMVELPVIISLLFLGILCNFQETLHPLANQETPGALLGQSGDTRRAFWANQEIPGALLVQSGDNRRSF